MENIIGSVRLSKKWNNNLLIRTLVILGVFSSITVVANIFLNSVVSSRGVKPFDGTLDAVLQSVTFVVMVIFLTVTFITCASVVYTLYRYKDDDFVIIFGRDGKIRYRTKINYTQYTISKNELEDIKMVKKGERGIKITLVYKKGRLKTVLGDSYDLTFMIEPSEEEKLVEILAEFKAEGR